MPKQSTAAKAADAPAPVNFSEGDSIMVDMSNVEEATFEALPVGMYAVMISDVNFKYSQNSGNPMWELILEVTDGEYASRKLYTHWVWAGKGLPFTKRIVAKIAPELLENPFSADDEDIMAALLGRELRAKVGVRIYDGDKTNNVKDLFLAGGEDSFM